MLSLCALGASPVWATAAEPDSSEHPKGPSPTEIAYGPAPSGMRRALRWRDVATRPSDVYVEHKALAADARRPAADRASAELREAPGPRLRLSGAGPSCAPRRLRRQNPDALMGCPAPRRHCGWFDGVSCSRACVRHTTWDHTGCGGRGVRHRHYDGASCNRRPITHRVYDNAGCSPRVIARGWVDGIGCQQRCIKHYTWDHVGCTHSEVEHALLDRQNVPCNPNDAAVITPLERVGIRTAQLFTDTRVNCELTGINSPIAIGDIVETEEYGRAVVIDYVFADRIEPYIYWKGTDIGDRGVVRKRRTRAIVQLVVQGTKSEALRIIGTNLTFTTVAPTKSSFVTTTLSPDETKAIMIRRMLDRDEPEKLLRAYPEERKNLDSWVAKFPKRPLRERDPKEWDRTPAGRKTPSTP